MQAASTFVAGLFGAAAVLESAVISLQGDLMDALLNDLADLGVGLDLRSLFLA